jgi:hypothetical protein
MITTVYSKYDAYVITVPIRTILEFMYNLFTRYVYTRYVFNTASSHVLYTVLGTYLTEGDMNAI